MNKPDKWAISFAIDVLDNWLNFHGTCPLHRDADEDEECTCDDEAKIIVVRDWLKEQRER